MRVIEWAKARAWGYWWKKCPRCGRWFGGHEKGWTMVRANYGERLFICPMHASHDAGKDANA